MRLEFARVVFSDSAYYSAVETARVVILFTSRSYYPLDIASATGSADLKMQAKMYNCSPRGVGKNGWLYRPFAKTGGGGGKRWLGTNANEWLY